MEKRKVHTIALIILGVLIILSGRLAYSDLTSGANGYCVLGSEAASCGSVQNSNYGSLFGIKVSYFGFVAFILLFVLYLVGLYNREIFNLFFFASLVGALFSIYFLFVQIFVLKTMCSTCSVIDVLVICVFYFAFIERKRR